MKKISILALAALAMVACGKKQTSETQFSKTEKVEVTTLHTQTIDRMVTLSGNLQGYEVLNVSPSLTGIVEHIYVEEGANVKAGDMLVRMDQTQYQAAELNYNNAKVDMARMEGLIATGSCSQQTYDQAKLAVNQYKVNLDFLAANTFYRAPFDGVITAKNLVDGSMYGGTPILELQQIDKVKVLIGVPESYIKGIHKGMNLKVKADVLGEEFDAFVEFVNPKIDPQTHTFLVKVVVPNPQHKLRPGMYVHTTFQTGKVDAILAPFSTVLKLIGANNRYVFINRDGYAQRVDVEMGQRVGEQVEIIAPEIVDGVELVTKGEARLIDGVELEIVARNE